MSKVKIQIGKAKKTDSKREQIEEAGFSFQRNNGEMSISIKFPGIEAIGFTREDLRIVIDRLDAPTIEGSGPGAVFARSATEDEEGNLVSKFSSGKRARSISFSPSDRHEIADLLAGLLNSWDDYAAALIEAEAKASETSNEGQDDNAAAAK